MVVSEFRDEAVARFAATYPERRRRLIQDRRFRLLPRIERLSWGFGVDLPLWQAIALYNDIDPDSIGATDAEAIGLLEELRPLTALEPSSFVTSLLQQLWDAGRALPLLLMDDAPPSSDPRTAVVNYQPFEEWARTARLPRVSDAYGWLQGGASLIEAELHRNRAGGTDPYGPYAAMAPAPKWPWGRHETALLLQLVEAAKCWRTPDEGGNYYPDVPSSAPTNEQIEYLLERNGVTSKKTREVMATILRADNLPSGPRRSTK